MKRLLYIALLMVLSNCTKQLVSIDYSEINPAIFPKSEADVEAMVNACYYPLRGAWWDGINTTSERGLMFAEDATTEILSGKYDIQQYGHGERLDGRSGFEWRRHKHRAQPSRDRPRL